MYPVNEDYARERVREAVSHATAASDRRYARRSQKAQRWQRVSDWAAHRSARVQHRFDV